MKRSVFYICFLSLLLISAPLINAQGVPAPYTMRLQRMYSGFNSPVLIRSARDGSKRLFVVQQTGIIKVMQPGSPTATDFINLSSKIVVPTSGGDERGLLGLTFHPQFATNGKFYVNYTRVGDGATIVAEYRTTTGDGSSNQGDINTERVLFTVPQPFSNHNGGMIEFGPDGFLYIGMGDGGSGNDPGNRAQNTSQLLGKMMRIDVNVPNGSQVQYLIPPTNPFTGANTARCDTGSTASGITCQEIWSIGLRNPWRWSFDRGGNNAIWVADVGQNAVEEVDNITSGGANFGWRPYEGTLCTGIDPGLCNPNNYTMPLFEYTHTAFPNRCAITGGYVYRGTQGSFPTGAYIYGDYCSGEVLIWRNNQQALLQDTPRLIPSFGEDEDGELYATYTNGQIDKMVRAKASADVDGDFKTDIAVFRPSNGVWYALNSSNGSIRAQQFGMNGDIAAPEDYDGDNITDIGVYRPSAGAWYYFRSSNGTIGSITWGTNGDVPVAGDYDGDAKADFAVFRPSNGTWYILKSGDGSVTIRQYGQSEDIPTAGDYDGDGKYDIAVWRPSNGVWYRLNSTTGGSLAIPFGLNGDIPAPSDLDGDGRNDLVLFRPSNGVWFSLQSMTGAFQAIQWGTSGDIPVTGDYDGDGKEDIGVFRPSNGVWYVINSSNGSFSFVPFGMAGDQPTPKYDAP